MPIREIVTDSGYDSRLYISRVSESRNADLVIKIRVYCERIDPAGANGTYTDANGTAIPIVNWGTNTQWETWRNSMLTAVEAHWNNKLWLIPHGFCWLSYPPVTSHDPTLLQNNYFIPNVKCGLDLRLVSRPNHGHVVLKCVKPAPGSPQFRSFMDRDENSGAIAEPDSAAVPINPVEGHNMVIAAHEMGHYLGLSHVHCSNNDLICYGSTVHQRGDIMGQGSRIEAWHSWPWRQRIRSHVYRTPGLTWQGTATRLSPTRIQLSTPHSRHRIPVGVPRPDGGV